MKIESMLAAALVAAIVSPAALADTYKCSKGGQTVYSDIPCAAGASRVDAGSDAVSRSQRKQAEDVHYRNRRQLGELEYNNAVQNRQINVFPSDSGTASYRGRRR